MSAIEIEIPACVDIECGSTLYVGLMGIVWKLTQKSMGMDMFNEEKNTANPLCFLSCRSMTF